MEKEFFETNGVFNYSDFTPDGLVPIILTDTTFKYQQKAIMGFVNLVDIQTISILGCVVELFCGERKLWILFQEEKQAKRFTESVFRRR